MHTHVCRHSIGAPVPTVVAGIRDAFSLTIADAFWVGLAATVVALAVVAVGLRDLPLRSTGLDPVDAVGEVAEGRAVPLASDTT